MIVSRCVTVVTLAVLSIACDPAYLPTAPSSLPTAASSLPTPLPPPAPPLIVGSTYRFSGPLSYAISAITSESRYLLDDHGSFALQYPQLPRDYRGTYRQDNGVLTFRFADDSRWEAIGTLRGDSLEVRYNLIMGLSDFEDAVYKLSQP